MERTHREKDTMWGRQCVEKTQSDEDTVRRGLFLGGHVGRRTQSEVRTVLGGYVVKRSQSEERTVLRRHKVRRTQSGEDTR